MFPHVELQKWNCPLSRVGLLIEQLLDNQSRANRVPRQNPPATPLDSQARRREMRSERVKRTEEFVNRRGQFTVGSVSGVRGEVGPENRVVDVSSEVERQILFEFVDSAERVARTGLFHLFESSVRAGDVSRVMLRVMQLHNPRRNVRFESRIIVS